MDVCLPKCCKRVLAHVTEEKRSNQAVKMGGFVVAEQQYWKSNGRPSTANAPADASGSSKPMLSLLALHASPCTAAHLALRMQRGPGMRLEEEQQEGVDSAEELRRSSNRLVPTGGRSGSCCSGSYCSGSIADVVGSWS